LGKADNFQDQRITTSDQTDTFYSQPSFPWTIQSETCRDY